MIRGSHDSGKTLAGIATALYRMQRQGVQYTWVVSSAISIRNNWNIVLEHYSLPHRLIDHLADLDAARPGEFLLITLNKLTTYQRPIRKWVRRYRASVQLIFDESDAMSDDTSLTCKTVLACFRRCRYKLLTTGTSIRNNICEFAPQLELLYNNSMLMLSESPVVYHRKDDEMQDQPNEYFGKPIPPYRKGYRLFSASHLPKKITVFGMERGTQDIYNADALTELLDKTVITRTFAEVTGKQLERLHQVPLYFSPDEKEVYQLAMKEFHALWHRYYKTTGSSRKDSMMKLVQQIHLLLRISAAPDTMEKYEGDTPVKIITAVEMVASWPDEIVAIGVRHVTVLESYAKALRDYLPDRPLFIVTGSSTSLAQRRALHKQLHDSKNGILLCTQQSLPSSVDFEYVNKVIIPELHYNNASMSQFYFRFIRYTSTEPTDIYFLTYLGSLETNQMQMVLAKEKLTSFMKGQDTDLDEVYQRFGIEFDLFTYMMVKDYDKDGHLHLDWGQQTIAS